MFWNYLKIALRNIRKHPLFSFINIFGLGLSMTVCMMVAIRVREGFSYDNFHKDPSSIFRVTTLAENVQGDSWKLATTPLPLQQLLAKDQQGIKAVTSFYPAVHDKATSNNKTLQVDGAFTQSSFFQVFGFTLAQGDAGRCLTAPNSIVLSADLAERIFGNAPAIGKIMQFEHFGLLNVTGVLEKSSHKSHLQFDALVSASTLPALEQAKLLPEKTNNWNALQDAYTYVKLNESSNEKSLETSLHQIELLINDDTKKGSVSFGIQSLKDITPSWGTLNFDNSQSHSWGKLLTESGIALLILFAACFNYINLTIARALSRGKEVGIRKVAGATRLQVFAQYLLEGVLMAFLAMFIAYFLLTIILRNQFFNDSYEFLPAIGIDAGILALLVSITFFTGLLAGVAPAWLLSAFKPVNVLKNISTTRLFGNITLQKSLIVFQFTLSLTVIIFLTVFYRQFSFLSKEPTGFAEKNIIVIDLKSADARILQQELAAVSGVENITKFTGDIGRSPAGYIPVTIDSKSEQQLQVPYFSGDENTLAVFDLKLLAGKNLEPGASEKQVLINEHAVPSFGFSSPSAAIGKRLVLADTSNVTISGVIKDFHYAGVARRTEPLLIRKTVDNYPSLYVKLSSNNQPATIAAFEKLYNELQPHETFAWTSLETKLAAGASQNATLSLMGFLAFMTIFIASFGLLGLVIYSVETKRKEISIRKIIGASTSQLLYLLSKGYVRLLLIASCIAMPIGFIMSYFFLMNFETRISIGWDVLLVCFLFLLIIASATILSQTYKAAAENPSKNLRME